MAVTRSTHQAGELARLLASAGAEPVEVPTISITEPSDGGAALAAAAARLSSFEWVAFTSANAVGPVLSALGGPEPLGAVRVAAVGEATAAALVGRGVVVAAVPETARGEELAGVMGPPLGEGRVLLPQAAGARDATRLALLGLGYEVEAVEAYRTIGASPDAARAAALSSCDAVTFSSPSTIEGFLAAYGRKALPPIVVTIGPVTTEKAAAAGVAVAVEAPRATAEGLVCALVEVASGRRRQCSP